VFALVAGLLVAAAGDVAAQEGGGGGSAPGGDAPQPPPAPPVARSANDDDPAPPARPAVDPDEPRVPRRRRLAPGPPPPPPPHTYRTDDGDLRPIRNPRWGLFFELGFGGGGEDLVKVSLSDGSTQTLSAGDGIAVSVGLMFTPLWVGDTLGIGFSGSVGYKGWSVGGSNGGISIGRFPLVLAAHLLPRLSPRWFLLARGGLDQEVGVSMSGSGVAAGPDLNLNANLGGFAEGGFYTILDTPEQRGAWSLTFRYTKITYTASGGSANAQSFMLFSNLYFNP
jgi:hypothetical protein